MDFLRPIVASQAPCSTILIRLIVGGTFLSEGIQKFLFVDALGVGRFVKKGKTNDLNQLHHRFRQRHGSIHRLLPGRFRLSGHAPVAQVDGVWHRGARPSPCTWRMPPTTPTRTRRPRRGTARSG